MIAIKNSSFISYFLSAFITFSTIPKIAERIKVFFALAPVFSIKYSKSPLIKMAYNWKSLIKVCYFFPFCSWQPKMIMILCFQNKKSWLCLHSHMYDLNFLASFTLDSCLCFYTGIAFYLWYFWMTHCVRNSVIKSSLHIALKFHPLI